MSPTNGTTLHRVDPIEELRAIKEIARRAIVSLQQGQATTGVAALNKIATKADDAIRWSTPAIGWLLTEQAVSLSQHADEVGQRLALKYGRSRVEEVRRGEDDRYCAVVVGMTDDIDRERVLVRSDGSEETIG